MTVGIIGLGLIGASYASALKSAGHTVYGHDRQEDVMRKATRDGLIDGDFFKHVKDCDIVVLALLPEVCSDFAKTHAHLFVPGQLLTDVAGVKTSLMREMESFLPEGVTYLSHHPMAGRPEGGYDHHDRHLFEGASAIVVESRKSESESFVYLTKLLETIGIRDSVTMDAPSHDRWIAHTSQLTHLISSALVLSGKKDLPLEAGGNSYRDLTRIADIDASLWTPLFMENKTALVDTLKAFQKTLESFEHSLENGDSDTLHTLLKRTREIWRKQRSS